MSLSVETSGSSSVNTHIGLETETLIIFGAVALFGLFVDIWAHRKDKPIALKSAIASADYFGSPSPCVSLATSTITSMQK